MSGYFHMKQLVKAAFIVISLTTFLSAFSSFSIAGQFKVTRVYDGDTIKIEGHDIEIRVRLVGIDAPEASKKKGERGQPYSKMAKQFLTTLILGKTVNIIGYGLDSYNRILGIVLCHGRSVNLEMLRAGYAEVYQGKPPREFDLTPYLDAEAEARKAKRGIWSLGDKYISPKQWRKMQTGK